MKKIVSTWIKAEGSRLYKGTRSEPKRISFINGIIKSINVGVNPPSQPNRIRRQVSPRLGIIAAVVIIMKPGFLIKVLAGKYSDAHTLLESSFFGGV